MARSYLAPGVYVEEVSGGARPIEPVGTSTAGFVGKAPDSRALVDQAQAITNWAQFCKKFAPDGSKSTPLSNAVYWFFENGGSRCFVVNIGSRDTLNDKGGKRTGLNCLEPLDISIVLAPGFDSIESYDAILSHCEKLQNRVAILDAPPDIDDMERLVEVGTAKRKTTTETASTDVKGGARPSQSDNGGVRPRQSDNGYGVFYYPQIQAMDPLAGAVVKMSPSGHCAGVWARNDGLKGVHKVPANEALRGALGVCYEVTEAEQEVLNPKSVNCIRVFPGEGIRIWGGRTLAASSSEWRYINVRRLFIMIRESIKRNTRWCVFEPNDRSLWKKMIRDVSAFLKMQWRAGALMGATPEDAFFVKCDEETNPPEVIDAGQVVCVVGIAPVKPAEFVVFEISQSREGAQAEEQ